MSGTRWRPRSRGAYSNLKSELVATLPRLPRAQSQGSWLPRHLWVAVCAPWGVSAHVATLATTAPLWTVSALLLSPGILVGLAHSWVPLLASLDLFSSLWACLPGACVLGTLVGKPNGGSKMPGLRQQPNWECSLGPGFITVPCGGWAGAWDQKE